MASSETPVATERPAIDEGFWRTLLAEQERALGAEHPEVALTRHHLALTVSERGDADEAGELLRRAEQSLASVAGDDDPRLASVRAAITALSNRGTDL